MYQDFENQIVRPTVLDDASFACLNYAMEDYLEKGKKALKLTSLNGKENEYVWQLSGGQKHLLALSSALSLSPDILVLDEPIAQLDPVHAKQIYDVLKSLNEEYGKTIVVIEHHTEFIAQYCKSVIMMSNGEVSWKLPTKEALNRVDELVLNNIFPPQVTIVANELLEKQVFKKAGLLPTTLEEGGIYFEGLELIKLIPKQTSIKKNNETVISFKNVSVEYRAVKGANKKIFDNFSLDIEKGEKIALIGNNGAGKSTVMKLIMGLIKPSVGSVSVYGTKTKDADSETLSQKVSYVYQNPEQMFIKDSIRNDIEYAMKSRHIERGSSSFSKI